MTSLSKKDDTVVMRTEALNDRRMQRLACEPDKVVYKYTYDDPSTVFPVISAQQQIDVISYWCMYFDMACRTMPNSCDEALRERTLAGRGAPAHVKPFIRTLQQMCPKVFASCCMRAVDDDDERRIDVTRKAIMSGLITKVEASADKTPEEIDAMGAALAMRLSMRPASAADLKTGIDVAAQLRVAGKEHEVAKLTPIDRMSQGPSTVRQK
jgi:hypothetical protein